MPSKRVRPCPPPFREPIQWVRHGRGREKGWGNVPEPREPYRLAPDARQLSVPLEKAVQPLVEQSSGLDLSRFFRGRDEVEILDQLSVENDERMRPKEVQQPVGGGIGPPSGTKSK